MGWGNWYIFLLYIHCITNTISNKNPIDYIKFYGKWNINGKRFTCKIIITYNNYADAFTIPRDKVSYIVPESYEEISIRIFARDPSLVPDIQMAFRRCMKSLTKSFVGQMNSNNSSPATNHQLLQLGDCCDSSAQVSPSKSVKEFEENPLETFPSKQEWDGIVRERGYSPNPKLTAKKNSQKQQKLNKNLLNELEDL